MENAIKQHLQEKVRMTIVVLCLLLRNVFLGECYSSL